MSKQDRQGVRTPSDVERKYNLGEIMQRVSELEKGLGGAEEDREHPGCYYRTVNGQREWWNPPMVLGEEYRTTERWRGLPVYRKYCYLGVTSAGSVTLDHGITDFSGCLEIQLTDGSHQNITHHSNIKDLHVIGAGVYITAEMAQTIYATIWYTKT